MYQNKTSIRSTTARVAGILLALEAKVNKLYSIVIEL